MTPAISVPADSSQDDIAVLFAYNPFLGVAVVDAGGVLLGVVSRLQVAEAELERAELQSLLR